MRRGHRAAHARIWSVLAVLLPLILVAALVVHKGGAGSPPVRLSAPEAAKP